VSQISINAKQEKNTEWAIHGNRTTVLRNTNSSSTELKADHNYQHSPHVKPQKQAANIIITELLSRQVNVTSQYIHANATFFECSCHKDILNFTFKRFQSETWLTVTQVLVPLAKGKRHYSTQTTTVLNCNPAYSNSKKTSYLTSQKFLQSLSVY